MISWFCHRKTKDKIYPEIVLKLWKEYIIKETMCEKFPEFKKNKKF